MIPKHSKQNCCVHRELFLPQQAMVCPGDQLAGDGVKVVSKDGEKDQTTNLFIADFDYIKTLGLQIIAGREFSKDHPTDADQAFIINETAVKEFGFGTPENAIGQKMAWDKWIR